MEDQNKIIFDEETLKALETIELIGKENPEALAKFLLKDGLTSEIVEQYCREHSIVIKDNPTLIALKYLEIQKSYAQKGILVSGPPGLGKTLK